MLQQSIDRVVPAGRASIRDYVTLFKPRIVALILFTAVAAACAAARGVPPAGVLALLVVSTALAAGGSAALNHSFDRDIDARMVRTRSIPIPSGRLSRPADALAVGLASCSLGVSLAFAGNLALGACLLAGAVSYVGIYTLWLKRRTPLNVVVGGLAGSCAVLAVLGDALAGGL